MNIAISGATGFIGKHLTRFLAEEGHRVIPLGRSMFREGMSGHLVQTLSHCDVVINLAGAPVNKRWTPEYKKELYDSRVHVTGYIVRAMEAVKNKPKLMISASAVGYYPLEGSFDEYAASRGEGFLSDLCYAWEKEAKRCPAATRLVITRFGIVLSPDGGAMEQMLKPLKLMRVGAAAGPGTQPFPWISIRDLCRAMEFIIDNESVRGIYNLVVPQQISQFAFTRALAKANRAWMTVVVPSAFFRLLYGEGGSFLTTGQNVRPSRLLEAGFQFVVPTVDKLLESTDHTTVNDLDVDRYMGIWHEIARYDHRFERGMIDVTVIYTLRPDGTIRVENRGCIHHEPYDVCKTVEGRARIPDASQPGKLKVSFFPGIYSDYYIMELDKENYGYALVGSSSDKYLWILSRTPVMPEDMKKKLLAAAVRRGYDINKLMWPASSPT